MNAGSINHSHNAKTYDINKNIAVCIYIYIYISLCMW